MDISFEKVIILIVISVLVMTSADSLKAYGAPVTREEAIEISKNSRLVKESLSTAWRFYFPPEANYYNSSMVEMLKTTHPWWTSIPIENGHSVWEVVWDIGTGRGGYVVGVVIDAGTGAIIHEEKGVIYH